MGNRDDYKNKMDRLIVGKRFERLVVLSRAQKMFGRTATFNCVCDCGNKIITSKGNLEKGLTKSCGCIALLPSGESSLRALFRSCKANAIRENREFKITAEQHREIIAKECHYCGEPPVDFNVYLTKDGKIRGNTTIRDQRSVLNAWVKINSVDRIDSEKGYLIENCVPSCWPCNHMKSDSKYEEFIQRAIKIAKFRNLCK